MLNIGSVLYRKGENKGTLKAEYFHPETGLGTGYASGGKGSGYEGIYQIQYFDINRNETVARELRIEKKENYFELYWLNDGEITAKGMGLETEVGLSAGWINV